MTGPGTTAALIRQSGPAAGRRFPIGERLLTSGRSADDDVVVADLAACRHHAEVRLERNGYVLVDRASANGTAER